MRVNITIPDDLLEDLDAYCVKYHFDRSEFLRQLIRTTIYGKILEKSEETLNTGKLTVEDGQATFNEPPTQQDRLTTARTVLQKVEATQSIGQCRICYYKRELHPVTYLKDAERTTENMCASCAAKIPTEMRIND